MNNLKVSIAICIFGFFVFGSSLYSEADLKVNSSQDLKNSEKDEKVPPEAKQTDSDSSKELQVEGESEKKPSLTSKDIANLFPLKLGFFVDSYYNASFNRPNSKEASYTTQATRTNEFNINLAYLDANFETNKYRGRFAVQFGTSVAANYVGEGTTGKTSNEFSVRNMQEAYGGIKLGKSTWLDMGIYFGHLGYESWVSHDNFVYTRALSLDNVPYYVSGVRLSGKITDKLKYQLHLDNGYQVVTDNNKDVSGGFRLEWTPLKSLMFR